MALTMLSKDPKIKYQISQKLSFSKNNVVVQHMTHGYIHPHFIKFCRLVWWICSNTIKSVTVLIIKIRNTHIRKLHNRFMAWLESTIDYINAIKFWIVNVFTHKSTKTGQICWYVRYTHDSTFSYNRSDEKVVVIFIL